MIHAGEVRQKAQFIFFDKLSDCLVPFVWLCVVDVRQVIRHVPVDMYLSANKTGRHENSCARSHFIPDQKAFTSFPMLLV